MGNKGIDRREFLKIAGLLSVPAISYSCLSKQSAVYPQIKQKGALPEVVKLAENVRRFHESREHCSLGDRAGIRYDLSIKMGRIEDRIVLCWAGNNSENNQIWFTNSCLVDSGLNGEDNGRNEEYLEKVNTINKIFDLYKDLSPRY